MAKSETDSLRDEEREIETEAAYAGGGKKPEGGEGQYLMEKPKKNDDIAFAQRVVDSAADEGGASGPGAGGEVSEIY